MVVRLEGSVQPASRRYLDRGLREADRRGASLIIIELDTPGGTLVSLRGMTRGIVASPVPVAVHVTPSGARAASAGFYLLLASDVAAMAPGTTTGAAHPVTIGQDGGEPGGQPSTAIQKATSDAAALARSLAAARGRPVQAAEQAVLESVSFTAAEARERGLIEHVVESRADLVAALDGREVRRFDGTRQTLQLSDEVVVIGPTVAERILGLIADPEVAYLLFLLGMLGILIEVFSPGAVLPGVLGGVSLLLALFAFSVLPVRVVGVLLLVVGVGLLVAEAFVTSYGLLAVAGVVAFVLGSLMLVDTPVPGWRIGLGLIVPMTIVVAAAILLLVSRAVEARRQPPLTGASALVGALGEVVASLEPAAAGQPASGKVFVRGEIWDAVAGEPLPGGRRVRVVALQGNRLTVQPAEGAPGS